jgi:hypothetical protein
MSSPNYLVDFKTAMARLITNGTFRIVGEKHEPAFFGNAVLLLEGSRILLRLTADRGQFLADVAPTSEPGQWWELRAVLRHLNPDGGIGRGPWDTVSELRDRLEQNVARLEQFVGSKDPALSRLHRAPAE